MTILLVHSKTKEKDTLINNKNDARCKSKLTKIMIEDYVNFKVAKLLKEKGFPQNYNPYNSMVYNEKDYEQEYEVQRMVLQTRLVKAGTLSNYPLSVQEPKCYAPTLQMAAKWLREIHCIYIEIEPNSFIGTKVNSYIATYWYNGSFYYPHSERHHKLYQKTWDTYEKALNGIIEYILTDLL